MRSLPKKVWTHVPFSYTRLHFFRFSDIIPPLLCRSGRNSFFPEFLHKRFFQKTHFLTTPNERWHTLLTGRVHLQASSLRMHPAQKGGEKIMGNDNDFEWETCGKCGGEGCKDCHGRGKFLVKKEQPPKITTVVLCPKCKGKGCDICNGKGGYSY